ncbi:hypothetical protein FB387_004635 [Streptomyces cinereoruber]|nr:hypothetical protein [Streptomyces cinereoruber]
MTAPRQIEYGTTPRQVRTADLHRQLVLQQPPRAPYHLGRE